MFPKQLHNKLNHLKENGLYRSLKNTYPHIDFSSNDYLGFSSRGLLFEELKKLNISVKTGSTGSRLISGNSSLFEEIEETIAQFHDADSAIIYNSGYDANIGFFSSVPQKRDLILSDELIHASIIDGIRLSFATHYKFKHKDSSSLRDLLHRHHDSFNTIYIVVESIYSMDGDSAPLMDMVALCKHYENVYLIVDEAHAIGVFGEKGQGICQALNIHNDCFARIYTYGKSMGCHGAAIVGNHQLRDYLINFSRSFIYTTAMTEHGLLSIKAAYQLLHSTQENKKLQKNITYFNKHVSKTQHFIASNSAIHCKVIPGNYKIQKIENLLAESDFFVKSIKSPTVKKNEERLRVCIHSFNTKEEIDLLLKKLDTISEIF